MLSDLKYTVEGVEVGVAENGYVVEVQYISTEQKKDGSWDYDNEKFIFEELDDALDKVKEVLTADDEGNGGDDDEKDE